MVPSNNIDLKRVGEEEPSLRWFRTVCLEYYKFLGD
jgi:hypothetical protein